MRALPKIVAFVISLAVVRRLPSPRRSGSATTRDAIRSMTGLRTRTAINRELKEGEITKQQAHQLHREDHAIRQEERDMAKINGGHITKGEQKVLNQQENAASRQIGR